MKRISLTFKTNLTYHALGVPQASALDGIPLASFRARTAAFVVDLFVIIVSFIIIGLPYALSHRSQNPDGNLVIPFDPFHGIWGFLSLVLYFGFVTYFGHGQTLGKRLFRIRVVSLVHDNLSLWHSVERAVGYGASALEGGFGFFQFFIHPNRQTVHDRIAETVVISSPPARRRRKRRTADSRRRVTFFGRNRISNR